MLFNLSHSSSLEAQSDNLKIPIAVLGEWSHPSYGKVVFSQKDFDEMLANWKANVCGFEPPLFLGHPGEEVEIKGSPNIAYSSMEGAPAVGYLSDLVQEDNVLYGIYEPTSQVSASTLLESYRYSSAEVVRKASSKSIPPQNVGTLLVGTALTNRPFLDMPRNSLIAGIKEQFSSPLSSFIFSNSTQTDSDLSIATEEKTSMESSENPTVPTELSSALAEQFSKLLENYQSLSSKYDALSANSTVLEEKLSITTAELKATQATLLQMSRQKKIDEINKLSLSAESKEKFAALINAGLPAEQEEEIRAMALSLSEQNKQVYSTQQGVVEDPKEVQPNPYASIISKTLKLANKN